MNTNENQFWKRLSEKASGKFIVLDGPDGCGKTTQLKRLKEAFAQARVDYISVRDPGDTPVGDSIRGILLGRDHEDRSIYCELMLFMASRAQLVAAKIKPALNEKKTVLSDRYVSASCAYQGAGGVPVDQILDIAQLATQRTWPDLTIVLDVPAEVGFERIDTQRNEVHDAMERRGLDYHQKVRDIFLKLPAIYPKPVVIVDATKSAETVHQTILETLIGVDY